jgi:hypothetical protein
MSRSFVALLWVEQTKEDIMSCVEYEKVRIEEFTGEKEGEVQGARPFVVPSIRVGLGDEVAVRVDEVLNFELAHGSMPT